VSHAVATRPLTSEVAARRNALVAQLASEIVVAYASPGGRLADLVAQWRQDGRPVTVLAVGDGRSG
jgi:hypothetical protein